MFIYLQEDVINLDETADENMKLADEFGLDFVATTSVGVGKKAPLRDITKLTKNSFAPKLKQSTSAGSLSKNRPGLSQKSDLPHFKRGFNGMGGQSKTLVIPKRVGSFSKPSLEKKGAVAFHKIPKNNTKITKFCTNSGI